MYSEVVQGVAYEVEFPFEPYPEQRHYIAKVIQAINEGKNALLESPTGTGKTLCLLCGSLAWRQNQLQRKLEEGVEQKNIHLPKIIYSSRTHSQLAQVVRELKASSYRPRMTILGSRQQMCVDAEVSMLTGTEQNMACRAKTKARACTHFNETEKFYNTNSRIGIDEPVDIEDLRNLQKDMGSCAPCPYYLTKQMAK
ncbi:Regulator of telomere elongation helicase 1, partial [Cymbomonas tetramitiformis]